MKRIKVLFFDLFFTLVEPKYDSHHNEFNLLKLDVNEWESFSEDESLYFKRARGIVSNPKEILREIINIGNFEISNELIEELTNLRIERFKKSLQNIEREVIDTLMFLRSKGYKLCLISNADVIDVMHWETSPLNELFDQVVFSYEVGFVKPEFEIYQIALLKMGVLPYEAVFIGDGGSNELLGAKKAEIITIKTNHFINREDVNKDNNASIDYMVSNFEDLIYILDQLETNT